MAINLNQGLIIQWRLFVSFLENLYTVKTKLGIYIYMSCKELLFIVGMHCLVSFFKRQGGKGWCLVRIPTPLLPLLPAAVPVLSPGTGWPPYKPLWVCRMLSCGGGHG